MPSLRAELFAATYMGGIYGWILLAWGLGTVPSPILIARVRQNSGAYTPAVETPAVRMVVALALPVLARLRPKAPAEVTEVPLPGAE